MLFTTRYRSIYISFLLAILHSSSVWAQDNNLLSKLRTYGWFDLNVVTSTQQGQQNAVRFDQAHMNLIFIYELSDNFLVFAEPEFEHGYSSNEDGLAQGKFYIQRAYLEYQQSDALRLRAGKFLTPFGLWNVVVDATAIRTGVFLPTSLHGTKPTPGGAQRGYAKYSTGFWLSGNPSFGNLQIEYDAYIANGRGQDAHELDRDGFKGYGGRFSIAPIPEIKVGSSFYSDNIGGNALNAQYVSGAFELTAKAGGFEFFSELLLANSQKIDAVKKEPIGGQFQRYMGYYGWLNYNIGETGLTPYAIFNSYDPNVETDNDAITDITIGLQYSLTPNILAKVQMQFVTPQNSTVAPYNVVAGQLAVAF